LENGCSLDIDHDTPRTVAKLTDFYVRALVLSSFQVETKI